MSDIPISGEFLGRDSHERMAKCRRLAVEADKLAADATNPDTRDSYLALKRQWIELANDIERAITNGK